MERFFFSPPTTTTTPAPVSIYFFYPSQSACRLCQSHGRSPEVQGFPPFPLQPFIADRLRSITRFEKGNDSYSALLEYNTTVPQHTPSAIPVELISVGGWFTFVQLTHRILDVRIVPLSVRGMKSCNDALRPLEDRLDGCEQ